MQSISAACNVCPLRTAVPACSCSAYTSSVNKYSAWRSPSLSLSPSISNSLSLFCFSGFPRFFSAPVSSCLVTRTVLSDRALTIVCFSQEEFVRKRKNNGLSFTEVGKILPILGWALPFLINSPSGWTSCTAKPSNQRISEVKCEEASAVNAWIVHQN